MSMRSEDEIKKRREVLVSIWPMEHEHHIFTVADVLFLLSRELEWVLDKE